MTLDYSSETPLRQFAVPPSLLSWVQLRSGQVKLFNFRVDFIPRFASPDPLLY